jgi:hypothetical protein
MLKQYRIADIVVRILGEDLLEDFHRKQFVPYETDSFTVPEITIVLKSNKYIDFPVGEMLLNEPVKWVKKRDNGYFIYSLVPEYQKDVVMLLAETDAEWRTVTLHVLENAPNFSPEIYKYLKSAHIFFLMGMIFRNKITHCNGFEIHASAIDYCGNGISFSAPSGTGKSTHTKLWLQYYGDRTRIINDDTPPVRLSKEGMAMIYGAPWCGSSFIGANAAVPLKALVVLERSDANTVERMRASDCTLKLLPRLLLPYFDKEILQETIDCFEKVLAAVPAYLLKCRIDKEAVELVRSCVM